MKIEVGQVWRCNGGAELRVTEAGRRGVVFVRRDGSSAFRLTFEMTPANGWELVEDVAPKAPQVKVTVGQVWRDRTGDVLRVDEYAGRDADEWLLTRLSDQSQFYADPACYPDRWTLVQDVGEASEWPEPAFYVHGKGLVPVPDHAPKPTACVDPEDAVCDCGSRAGEPHIGCGVTTPAPDPCDCMAHQVDMPEYCQGPTDPCAVEDADGYERLMGQCDVCGQHSELFHESTPRGFECQGCLDQSHACAAALAALPVSADFPVGTLNTCERPLRLTRERAEADLRRKLSTLRAWPTCPRDGTPYGVEASVREVGRWHDQETCYEAIRYWRATFVCGCGGGR